MQIIGIWRLSAHASSMPCPVDGNDTSARTRLHEPESNSALVAYDSLISLSCGKIKLNDLDNGEDFKGVYNNDL